MLPVALWRAQTTYNPMPKWEVDLVGLGISASSAVAGTAAGVPGSRATVTWL